MTKIKFTKQIINHAIDLLESLDYEETYGCDLHNELFNTDYYVIGYYEANKFIESYGGAWETISRIKSYEKEIFGEVSTDLSDCEKVANMLAYIAGEALLMECKTLGENWDNRLTAENIENIIIELEELN